MGRYYKQSLGPKTGCARVGDEGETSGMRGSGGERERSGIGGERATDVRGRE